MSWSSVALSTTKDFELISGRNIFKLQPVLAPTLPVPPALPKVMPKVVITGITDICGRRQVLAEISDPGRPAAKAVLAEGERVGLVEVLHIDVGRGLVDMRIHGEQSTLSLQSPSDTASVSNSPLKPRSQ